MDEEDQMTNRLISVTVYNGDGHDDYPPTDATGFMTWFAERLATIPPEFLETATIEITNAGDYVIEYVRPETTAEELARQGAEAIRARQHEVAEREEYAKLKAKYDP